MLNIKYKPNNINDCYISIDNKNKINLLIKNNSFQNTIFYGENGTCKSTVINLILEHLKVPQKNILRINLLFDKNIKTLNNDLESFSKIKCTENLKKIIIIENFDAVNSKIQKNICVAVNKLNNLLMFFECLNIVEIISELQSQCMIFEFLVLDKKNYVEYISNICKQENITIDDSVILELYILSTGNIRFSLIQISIMMLLSNNLNITLFEQIYKIPNPTIVNNLINLCTHKETNLYIHSKKIISECDLLFKQKYSCNELLMAMFNNIIYNDIKDDVKNNLLQILGKYIYKFNKYIESPLQMKYCLLKIITKLHYI